MKNLFFMSVLGLMSLGMLAKDNLEKEIQLESTTSKVITITKIDCFENTRWRVHCTSGDYEFETPTDDLGAALEAGNALCALYDNPKKKTVSAN